MQKKVLISLMGTQQFAEEHEDKQELITVGAFYVHKGVFYILYRESEVTGMEGTTTTLRIEEDHVVLNRMGTAELKQEFRPGVLYRSTYITPFGKLWLSVLPDVVESDLTAQGGRISLEYDLFVDDNFVSHNLLWVTIKEDNPQ